MVRFDKCGCCENLVDDNNSASVFLDEECTAWVNVCPECWEKIDAIGTKARLEAERIAVILALRKDRIYHR